MSSSPKPKVSKLFKQAVMWCKIILPRRNSWIETPLAVLTYSCMRELLLQFEKTKTNEK